MLVCEDQGLVVFVLQVVQHSVRSIAALVHVGQGVLPSAEVAHIPCNHRTAEGQQQASGKQQSQKVELSSPVAGNHTVMHQN